MGDCDGRNSRAWPHAPCAGLSLINLCCEHEVVFSRQGTKRTWPVMFAVPYRNLTDTTELPVILQFSQQMCMVSTGLKTNPRSTSEDTSALKVIISEHTFAFSLHSLA